MMPAKQVQKQINNEPKKVQNKKKNEEIADKVAIKDGELPVKVFENRNSVLTDLLENKHITTIYHIFVCLFIGTAVNSIANNYFVNNRIDLGLDLIIEGFRNFDLCMLFWICVFSLSLLPYYFIKYWSLVRDLIKPNRVLVYLWDKLCLLGHIMFVIGIIVFATWVPFHYNFGFATTVCALTETTRLIMKMYAFSRSCIPRFLVTSTEKKTKKAVYPSLSHYVYFSFAPTLIYRDNYPRSSEKIRWAHVLKSFAEVIVGIFFYSFYIDRTYISQLKEYGLKPYTYGDIIMIMLDNTFYGMLSMLIIYYIVLHAWLNAFAEMLRFSDKLFYKDWWTSLNYGRYYRTWNTVVHDWLHTYVYKDFYEIVVPKNKIVAKFMVFFVSSLFHDYIVSVAIGFFLPIFLVYFFMIGNAVSFVKIQSSVIGNIFLLYSIALGASMMLTMYAMEYFARVNCVKEETSISIFFTPQLFSCYK